MSGCKKRTYRQLWTIRLNAACRQHEISYSRFMDGLKKAKIEINRKVLSHIAIHDPETFEALVKQVKGKKKA